MGELLPSNWGICSGVRGQAGEEGRRIGSESIAFRFEKLKLSSGHGFERVALSEHGKRFIERELELEKSFNLDPGLDGSTLIVLGLRESYNIVLLLKTKLLEWDTLKFPELICPWSEDVSFLV